MININNKIISIDDLYSIIEENIQKIDKAKNIESILTNFSYEICTKKDYKEEVKDIIKSIENHWIKKEDYLKIAKFIKKWNILIILDLRENNFKNNILYKIKKIEINNIKLDNVNELELDLKEIMKIEKEESKYILDIYNKDKILETNYITDNRYEIINLI